MPNQKSDLQQQGLKRQLISRFVLVFAFAFLLGGLGAMAGYRLITTQSHQQAANDTAKHITYNFGQIKLAWEDDAVKLKTQIDFMRLLAGDSPNRWLKLHAYLTAQEGMDSSVDTLLILRRDGSLAFASGPASQEIEEGWPRALPAKCRLSKNGRALQLVVRLPIWLGDEGQGTMLLLRPLENDTLIALAPPGVELSLVAQGKVIASSRGSAGLDETIDPDFSGVAHVRGMPVEQRTLPFTKDETVAAHVVMRQHFREPFTSPGIIAAATLWFTLLFIMLWLVLGRWIRQITQRISQLSRATPRFAETHTVDNEVRQLLGPRRDTADEITEISAACQDMMSSTEQHEEEQRAYIRTLDMLEEGVVELDREGRLIRASSGWLKLSGCKDGARPFIYQCVHPEDVQVLTNQIESLFSGEKNQVTGRMRLVSADENEEWIEYRFIAATSGTGGARNVRGVMRDITQNYQMEKRITQMALHDALTGLPNRILLEDRCELSLGMADRTERLVAVGFIDLDHFKNINDTFGHKTGDRLLVVLANALKQALRAGDTLARWGGDEFIVLLPDLPDIESARQAAQKLIETCTQAVTLDENEFNVTFSIGIALYPDDADNVETLLSQADRAMFHAKALGRNNIQFYYDMASKGLGKKEIYIQNRLSAAIRNGQIQTWFQPLVDAKSCRVTGLESLARWHDEEYGWISPATFIPMAENLGLIKELGEQVWLETLRQGQRWRQMGFDLQLSVNISRRQLFMPSFTTMLLESLQTFDIPSSAIVLEITESTALTDFEYTSKRLKELSDAGFTLSIDDFGTGYSSLSQLHNMPVREIKIDISFVRRIHDPQGADLVQAILHMAEAFKLHSVAEGVEDEETAQILREYGVQSLQGYLFGKPMPAHEIDNTLIATNIHK